MTVLGFLLVTKLSSIRYGSFLRVMTAGSMVTGKAASLSQFSSGEYTMRQRSLACLHGSKEMATAPVSIFSASVMNGAGRVNGISPSGATNSISSFSRSSGTKSGACRINAISFAASRSWMIHPRATVGCIRDHRPGHRCVHGQPVRKTMTPVSRVSVEVYGISSPEFRLCQKHHSINNVVRHLIIEQINMLRIHVGRLSPIQCFVPPIYRGLYQSNSVHRPDIIPQRRGQTRLFPHVER